MKVTRAERVKQIAGLRADGLTLQQIGAALGITRSGVKAILYDPDGSKQLARRKRYQGTCSQCGAATDGSNGRAAAPGVCASCTVIWTAPRVIEAIQEWASEHGHPPSQLDWPIATPSHPVYSTAQRLFGSWRNAIVAAGFPRPRRWGPQGYVKYGERAA